GLLTHNDGANGALLRRLIGLLTILFLTLYAAAQLKAGAKATSELLGWSAATGPLVGALIVLIYSASGGLRASIWTDAAQSFVMIAGMAGLVVAGVEGAGGAEAALDAMGKVDPHYMDWFPPGGIYSSVLFIAGWFFGGFVVVGQPHVLVRLVSMDPSASLARMRMVYYGWFTAFYGATIMVGMLSRITLKTGDGFDSELALPRMALMLLPEWMTGLVLAALFAATLSTADSLILSCSAALTRDIGIGRSLAWAKISTAMVLLAATIIALGADQSVFALVLDAWGLLGSAFAPLVVVKARGWRCTPAQALSMVVGGVAVFIIWNWLGLSSVAYAPLAGVATGFSIYMISGRMR
ncbi:MAG: sodium/proline symporter, partial [Nitrospinota bacterium]|nr:sodium/proline symporter [Nitrospinota bacterium]